MDNLLRQISVDDVVIYSRKRYNAEDRKKYLELFDKMCSDGKITGQYDDPQWICRNGVRTFSIDFSFSEPLYASHAEKDLNLSYSTISDMLRCYALYLCGGYIFRTIAERVNGIKTFLTSFRDARYIADPTSMNGIESFLEFISVPDHDADVITRQISTSAATHGGQRELSHLINYVAIANEVTELYAGDISTEDFIRWFPIFFWANITFILPLRATEMLVTPYNCISRKDGNVEISVRRTMLKGGGKGVSYEVDRDYKIFSYRIPDSPAVRVIERYIELTSEHKRRFLFDFGELSSNEILSLQSFNLMLEDFINEYLRANYKYDYAKFATGINEFESVTAGDSRPIALANLYYQNAGSDICRQLANHIRLDTTSGYYRNVAKTVEASSIMKFQKELNKKGDTLELLQAVHSKSEDIDIPSCSSERQPKITGDISDCAREDHLEDCLGCRYHNPSSSELETALRERKAKLDAASKAVIECLTTGAEEKKGIDFDKLFLDAHTGIVRYRVACDEKAKEKVKAWRRHQPTQTNSSSTQS